jgi:hypothetical protein
MTLLKRKRVLAAKIEGTVGTAESLLAADAAFNAYDVMIQPNIDFEEREGQGSFGYLASVPGGYRGTATFKTDISWDGTGDPSWASTFFPACGLVKDTGVWYPKTAAPGSDVKTLTIGCYLDGIFKSIKGAAGTFRIILPTGRRATIEWTFTGIWVTPSDTAILDPTYPGYETPTPEMPLRAAGTQATFNSVALCYENATIDVANEVIMRECATDASGFHSALITNRKPMVTANPEAKLVATRPSYTNWLARLEATLAITVPSATGNGSIAFSAPKAQIINIQEGDRSRLVTDEIEWQCNRNGQSDDREFSITFTDNS